MVRPGLGRGFALGEHRFEVARYRVAMRSQLAVEVLPGSEAAHGGDARAVVLVFRQVMALRVVEVLQAMLDVAQEDVGRAQLVHRRGWKKVLLAQDSQGLQRWLDAKLGIAPAADQLHRLHDELDLADPARPELDVLGELAAGNVAPDFGVQRPHRRQRGVVEVLAENERPHDAIERGGGRGRAAEGARLEPGIALPFAPLRDQVVLQRIEVARQRSGIAIRPQAHVDAEHEAILGLLRQQPDQAAPRLLIALSQLVRAVVEKHEIDVGRDVELAPAELAHADDDQVAVGHGPGKCHLRQVAHGRANLVEVGAARQVPRHHAQQDPVAQFTQRALVIPLVILPGAERVLHFGARERRRIGELGGERRTRVQHALREARQPEFANGFRHLKVRMAAWT